MKNIFIKIKQYDKYMINKSEINVTKQNMKLKDDINEI
jgi:hypothetical protein